MVVSNEMAILQTALKFTFIKERRTFIKHRKSYIVGNWKHRVKALCYVKPSIPILCTASFSVEMIETME